MSEEQAQMTVESRDEILATLCKLSDRQLDERVKPRLQALMGRPHEDVKDELMGIIDDCVYASLSSGFEIKAMHVLWLNCGGSEQELQERNAMLNDEAKVEELRPRFKWQTH